MARFRALDRRSLRLWFLAALFATGMVYLDVLLREPEEKRPTPPPAPAQNGEFIEIF